MKLKAGRKVGIIVSTRDTVFVQDELLRVYLEEGIE